MTSIRQPSRSSPCTVEANVNRFARPTKAQVLRVTTAVVAFVLIGSAQPLAPALAGSTTASDLLDGVEQVAAPGVPGPLCVYGEDAFAVVAGGSTGNSLEPVIAAADMGDGRVAALGHNGYFTSGALDTADTARLLLNVARWVTTDSGSATPRVGVANRPDMVALLEQNGFESELLDLARLEEYDAVVVEPWAFAIDDVPRMAAYVRSGGGFISGGPAWGWMQLNPGLDRETDLAGNRLLSQVGIQWADGYLSRTSDLGYQADEPPPELIHGAIALEALEQFAAGSRELADDDRDQIVTTLTQVAACLPRDDTILLPRMRALLGSDDVRRVPTPQEPMGRDEVVARLALALEAAEFGRLAPEEVAAHPAAASFPGAVPVEAARVTRQVTIDCRTPGRHSTGLYAAPGEVVEARQSASAAQLGMRLRIGAHSDTLWHMDVWRRAPEITTLHAIDQPVSKAASPFGGLVYIEAPRGCSASGVEVELRNVVEAPYYVHGETPLDTWISTVRHSPAPWAELESRNIVLTVPSEVVRELDSPGPLMATWDQILDTTADLAGAPVVRERPERIVPDEQISAGYMHSGYPIMTHLDQRTNLVDRNHLVEEGNWGLFHEIGHNHQASAWTFSGTVEVTVNLFTLFIYDRICGIPPEDHPRSSREAREQQMARYDFDNPDFEQWKQEPFLALVAYVQLQQQFGWETYQDLFREYLALTDDERPTTDDEKRDQWLVRYSLAVGYNLAPFFEAWGIPTSAAARQSIAHLPTWMPDGFPPGAPSEPTPIPGPSPTPDTGAAATLYLPVAHRS